MEVKQLLLDAWKKIHKSQLNKTTKLQKFIIHNSKITNFQNNELLKFNSQHKAHK
jgi:hypothetical protein